MLPIHRGSPRFAIRCRRPRSDAEACHRCKLCHHSELSPLCLNGAGPSCFPTTILPTISHSYAEEGLSQVPQSCQAGQLAYP